jgi:hypothetical protein
MIVVTTEKQSVYMNTSHVLYCVPSPNLSTTSFLIIPTQNAHLRHPWRNRPSRQLHPRRPPAIHHQRQYKRPNLHPRLRPLQTKAPHHAASPNLSPKHHHPRRPDNQHVPYSLLHSQHPRRLHVRSSNRQCALLQHSARASARGIGCDGRDKQKQRSVQQSAGETGNSLVRFSRATSHGRPSRPVQSSNAHRRLLRLRRSAPSRNIPALAHSLKRGINLHQTRRPSARQTSRAQAQHHTARDFLIIRRSRRRNGGRGGLESRRLGRSKRERERCAGERGDAG